ncbi:hypothetical protein [Clostridium tertium]|uniref:hypothetical protein n=1 Tax=Clostridium tertium TaxID=1559 RepID=UPI002248FFC9
MKIDINIFTLIWTVFNFVVLIAIIILLYKVIKVIKNFIIRNKNIDKKVDIILNKLDNKLK